MLGLAHFSLEECADMYRRFGSEVFRQNPLVGTVKMGWTHSYYDTATWETILQYAQTVHTAAILAGNSRVNTGVPNNTN